MHNEPVCILRHMFKQLIFIVPIIIYVTKLIINISYRVTGLYQLGKTCYLHSLVCNNSIICIVCAKWYYFNLHMGKL